MKIKILAFILILNLFSIAMAGNMQTNIEYGKAGDETLLLDVNSPNGDGPFPIAIIVHGGGWTRGDKQGEEGEKVLFGPLVDANFIVVSINYRLAPKNKWPACIDDVLTTIKWVKANGAKYKGDTDKIALFGYSAGGQLACLAAVIAEKETTVAAVVGLAAPTDLVFDSLRRGSVSSYLKDLFGLQGTDVNSPQAVQVLWDASPINHLQKGLPPFLLVHGTADKSVPYQLSLNFQDRLKEFKVPCELITINGASHKIVEWDKFDADYMKKIVAWLNKTMVKK